MIRYKPHYSPGNSAQGQTIDQRLGSDVDSVDSGYPTARRDGAEGAEAADVLHVRTVPLVVGQRKERVETPPDSLQETGGNDTGDLRADQLDETGV